MFAFVAQGVHHVFVADLPVAVISLALIKSTAGEIRPCEGDSVNWAEAMLWVKGGSMMWAVLSTITQLLLTGHCGTSVRGGTESMDGSLEVETVASMMRSSVGSFTVSMRTTPLLRQDRTSQWVDDGGGGGGGSSDGGSSDSRGNLRGSGGFHSVVPGGSE